MRVCEPHKVKAVVTLKNTRDDTEYDMCPECFEAFSLLVSGAFFATDETRKRGRPPKATVTA